MSVNPDIAGVQYPAIDPYPVSAPVIAEFARTVRAQNPVHFSAQAAQQAGHADVLAPPTFAVVIAQKAEAAVVQDPQAGIDFSRVVHADQQFTHHRPIMAGDVLSASTTVDKVRAMGSGAMVSLRTEIIDSASQPVATCLASLLVRGEEQ